MHSKDNAMDTQNELDFRLARSQFLYEQAERKARQAARWDYWSKWGKTAWWTLIAATFVLFVLSDPRAIVLIVIGGIVSVLLTAMFAHPPRDYPPGRSDFLG
jgi:hypothetical protein